MVGCFVAMRGHRTLRGRAIVGSAVLLAAAAAASVAQSGCGKDGEATTSRASRRGELCQVTNDCADGLSCAPIAPGGGGLNGGGGGASGGGVCVTGQFHISPTAKQCSIVECSNASDCCDDSLAAGCEQLRVLCQADAGTASAQACQQYAQQCGCLTGQIQCQMGKCVSHCTTDLNCTDQGSGRRCAGGHCVQCAIDGDCAPGSTCVTGGCQAACTGDGDCGGFDRCISGKCLASGCQTDRECVASTRNVDARCGTDGKCIVPCETDLECGNPTSYNFFSCIDKECTYVGCDSDKDCRLFYTGPADSSTLPLKQHAVCRDNGALGTVVQPAR